MSRAFNATLFGLGLAGAVAVLPGTIDAFLSLRWAIVSVMIPLLLLWLGRDVAPIPRLVFAFVAFAGVSLLWTPMFGHGLDDFAHLVILAAAFWLGASLTNATPLWNGLAVGVSASAAIAVAQWGWDWYGIPQAVPPAGLFANKNFLAEAAMVSVIVSLGSRTRVGVALAAAALVAVVLGSSKAVFGALMVTLAFWLAPRRPVLGWSLMGLAAILFVAALALPFGSAADRFPIWSGGVSDAALLGHGVGAFSAAFPIWENAHSEPIQLFYEFGLLAVIPAVIFAKAMEGWSGETEGYVLVAVAAVALWSFPLHLPLTALAASVAAGRLAGARDRLVRRRLDGGFALGVGA